jgi:NitT/TauT family transport system substrate-binding protein
MKRRTAILATLALGATLPLPARAATAIRIAVSNGDVAAEPLYAQDRGIFAAAGLDATIATNLQGAATLAALHAGTIDVGFANIVSIAEAFERGEPLALLAAGSLYTSAAPITVLVAAAGSTYRTGADLDGKAIATPSGRRDLGAIGTSAWIDRHGGNSRTIRWKTGLAFSEVGRALQRGDLDASELTEPEVTRQRRAGLIRVVAATFDAVAPAFVIGGFVARRAWVRAHPEAARRFTAAMRETAVWANGHHAETAVLLARRLHVSRELVDSMVRATYPRRATARAVGRAQGTRIRSAARMGRAIAP